MPVIFCDVAMASGLGEPEKTLLYRSWHVHYNET